MILGGAVVLAAVVIWFAVGFWAVKDKNVQKSMIDGANYRKEHDLFKLAKYLHAGAKPVVPKRQHDTGADPKTYGKKIPCVDHFRGSYLKQSDQSREGMAYVKCNGCSALFSKHGPKAFYQRIDECL